LTPGDMVSGMHAAQKVNREQMLQQQVELWYKSARYFCAFPRPGNQRL